MTIQEQVEEFLRAIWTEGDILEVRGLYGDGRKSVFAGLYTDLKTAAIAATNLSRDRKMNVGWCVNPVVANSYHATENPINVMRRNTGHCAGRSCIDTRGNFMVDIDPERIGMKNVEC